MNKIIIISLSILLSACSTSNNEHHKKIETQEINLDIINCKPDSKSLECINKKIEEEELYDNLF